MPITVEISMGEAYDRLSILFIKKEKFGVTSMKGNLVRAQFDALSEQFSKDTLPDFDAANTLMWLEILKTNQQLWEVEDKLRNMDKALDFSKRFVELARSVYVLNDRRSVFKQKIDHAFNEAVGDVKSYVDVEAG